MCREHERQKAAKLTELKAADDRRQMLLNNDADVSVIDMYLSHLSIYHFAATIIIIQVFCFEFSS